MHDDRSSPESAADMAVFDDTRKLHMALGLMSNAEKDNIEIGRRLEAAEARIEELEGELRSLTPAQQPASPVTDDQYRKKPVVIRAWRLGSEEARPEWAKWTFGNGHDYAEVQTLEGTMRGNRGDWIIQGVKGELYFCKPDIFAATYEPASAPAQCVPSRIDKGRAFYLAMYEKDGAIWAANDHKELWCDMAEDYERRLCAVTSTQAPAQCARDAGLEEAAKYHDRNAADCRAIASVNMDNDLGADSQTHAIDHEIAADDIRAMKGSTVTSTDGGGA